MLIVYHEILVVSWQGVCLCPRNVLAEWIKFQWSMIKME